MRLRLLPALLALTGFPAPWVHADSYAVISATTAERLPTLAGTPDAQEVLAGAMSHLERPAHPLPVVHTEGTLPHKGIHDASAIAEGDWPIMLAFALGARLRHDPILLQAEEGYLRAWLSVYHSSYDPIDETGIDQMIMAYDLVGAQLPVDLQAKMQTFMRDLAEGYLAAIARAKKEDTANWQSHRIKLITLCAFALGDPKLITEARRVFTRQIAVNIKPDGEVVDFAKRDALHYVVYDLEPLSVAALAAREHGEDWFNPKPGQASSLRQGLDWLRPYALGEKPHDEFVHSTVNFDAARAKAGLKEYSGAWNRATSLYLYQLAALFDPAYAPVVHHLVEQGGHPRAWVGLLRQAGL